MVPKAWAPYFIDPQSPWGLLLAFKMLLGTIPDYTQDYFGFIEACLSVACTNEDTKE